jgi:hypothetical protein
MGRIKARLKDISDPWEPMIMVVMNLVMLSKEVPFIRLDSENRHFKAI